MKVSAVGPRIRTFTQRVRGFSTQSSYAQEPVIFVKEGPSPRANSLLGPSDKQFPLPGDVCHNLMYNAAPSIAVTAAEPKSVEMSSTSLRELLSASCVEADAKYLNELREEALAEAQERAGDLPIELTAQECPRLLRKELKHLFPDLRVDPSKVNVLNLTQKSKCDMSAWSREMEDERDALTASFIASGQAICGALRKCGYWADFIDPSSGRAFLGGYSNHTLFETDDAYKFMGFRIEDLGCCKVLQHIAWHTNAFVGTLFTNAPLESQIVQDILTKVNDESESC